MSESDSAKTKTARTRTTKRASTRTSTKAASVRKTATKKTTRKTASKKTATKKTTRKTTTKKATTTAPATKSVETEELINPEEQEVVPEEVVAVERKAPTSQPQVAGKKFNLPPTPHIVVGAIASLLLLSSVVIGVSDPGEISIQGVVAERNQEIVERQERGEEVGELIIPVQDSSSRTPRPQLRPSAAGRSAATNQQNTIAGSATSTEESLATTTITDVGDVEEAVDAEDVEETEELENLTEESE